MALRLPTIVPEARVQQCLDFIARQFPIQSANLAAGAVGVSNLSAAAKELFLQLATPASRKVDFGSTELEFPGENIRTNAKEVSHAIGATPKAVTATANDDGRVVGVTAISSTKITLRAQTAQGDKPAAPSKVTVYWIAIG
jgi:hypothetical protein